jgi:hypothetical protein
MLHVPPNSSTVTNLPALNFVTDIKHKTYLALYIFLIFSSPPSGAKILLRTHFCYHYSVDYFDTRF